MNTTQSQHGVRYNNDPRFPSNYSRGSCNNTYLFSSNDGRRFPSRPQGFSNNSPRGFPYNSPRGFSSNSPRGFQNNSSRGFQNNSPQGYSNYCHRGFSDNSPRGFSNSPQGFSNSPRGFSNSPRGFSNSPRGFSNNSPQGFSSGNVSKSSDFKRIMSDPWAKLYSKLPEKKRLLLEKCEGNIVNKKRKVSPEAEFV